MRIITLLLSGALFGCSTTHHPTAVHQTNSLPLYVYWGSEEGGSASRFLSVRIYLGEYIFVGGDDFLGLRGNIGQRGTNLLADLMGSTGQQSQFYQGNMTLEKPFLAQGGAASGGAGPRFWFLISTNLECKAILEHVNRVRGFTNAPFSHPAVPVPPLLSSAPKNIDPATGLPWSSRTVDPITGLPEKSAYETFTQQMADILGECESMKPGMTREDLLRFFTTDGGLSTQKSGTFVNNRCPYIKIDVGFAPTESKEEGPTDIITKITKPYLTRRIGD